MHVAAFRLIGVSATSMTVSRGTILLPRREPPGGLIVLLERLIDSLLGTIVALAFLLPPHFLRRPLRRAATTTASTPDEETRRVLGRRPPSQVLPLRGTILNLRGLLSRRSGDIEVASSEEVLLGSR